MKVTHKNVFKKTGPAITLWTEADLEEYARLREEEKVQMGGEDRQQSLEKARQMTVDPEAIAKAMGKQTEAVEQVGMSTSEVDMSGVMKSLRGMEELHWERERKSHRN
jgi:hypothetical protein